MCTGGSERILSRIWHFAAGYGSLSHRLLPCAQMVIEKVPGMYLVRTVHCRVFCLFVCLRAWAVGHDRLSHWLLSCAQIINNGELIIINPIITQKLDKSSLKFAMCYLFVSLLTWAMGTVLRYNWQCIKYWFYFANNFLIFFWTATTWRGKGIWHFFMKRDTKEVAAVPLISGVLSIGSPRNTSRRWSPSSGACTCSWGIW